MPNFHYMPWYPRDFISDQRTRSLSLADKGLLRDILDRLWLDPNARLPANPDNLVAHLSLKKGADSLWRQSLARLVSSGLLLVVHETDGSSFITNARLVEERHLANAKFDYKRDQSGKFIPKDQNPTYARPNPRPRPDLGKSKNVELPLESTNDMSIPDSGVASSAVVVVENPIPLSLPLPKNRKKPPSELTVGSNGSDPPTLTQEPHFCPACNLRQMSSACIRCKQPTIACG
jgi:hypothetical protein